MNKRMLTTPVTSEFYQAVRLAAAQRGISMAALVRETLKKVVQPPQGGTNGVSSIKAG